MMKKNYRLIACLSVSMLLFTGCASGQKPQETGAQTTAAPLDEEQNVSERPSDKKENEKISIEVKEGQSYEKEEGTLSAKIRRPVLVDQNGTELSINKEISEYVDSLIAEYEENKAASEKEEGDVHYAVSNTYEVTHDGEQYFSMYMAAARIMGSGSETYQTYTIDKKTGEAVSLGELLGNEETLRLVSENISAQMEEQMKEDASVVYFQASEGGFSGLTGDESFYLNQDGSLVVVFDEYTVAPGSMGMVEFTIPTETAGAFR